MTDPGSSHPDAAPSRDRHGLVLRNAEGEAVYFDARGTTVPMGGIRVPLFHKESSVDPRSSYARSAWLLALALHRHTR